jgi:hypothetical protein
MAASDTTSKPLIAVVVSEVARTFLSLVTALEVHEDFKTQVPPTAAHDEFTRLRSDSASKWLRNELTAEDVGW